MTNLTKMVAVATILGCFFVATPALAQSDNCMSLNMLVESPGGSDYAGAEFDAWARSAGFTRTEGFPQDDIPSRLVMRREHVAGVIVDVVRRGRSPEVSVPRALGAAQAFRVLTPPVYRWGVARVTKGSRKRRIGPIEPPPPPDS